MEKGEILQRLTDKRKSGRMIFAMTASTGGIVKAAKEAGVDFAVVHKESLFGIDGRLPALARVGYGGNCNEMILKEAEHILRFADEFPVIAGVGVAEPYHNIDRITEKIIKKGYSGITHIPTSGGWVGDFGNSISQAGCGYSEEVEYIRRWSGKEVFTVGYCFEETQINEMNEARADVIAVHVQKTAGESHGWHNAKSREEAIKKAEKMVRLAKGLNPDGIVLAAAGEVGNAVEMEKLVSASGADGYLADEALEDGLVYKMIYEEIQEIKNRIGGM